MWPHIPCQGQVDNHGGETRSSHTPHYFKICKLYSKLCNTIWTYSLSLSRRETVIWLLYNNLLICCWPQSFLHFTVGATVTAERAPRNGCCIIAWANNPRENNGGGGKGYTMTHEKYKCLAFPPAHLATNHAKDIVFYIRTLPHKENVKHASHSRRFSLSTAGRG